jgi:hypothetical protein
VLTREIQFDQFALRIGDSGIRVDRSVLSQMRSNSRFDPIVVPVGYQFGYANRVVSVESGKCPDPARSWFGERIQVTPKTELSFEDWLPHSDLPKPTAESHRLWFGEASVRPVENSSNNPDKSRLSVALPRLADLERSEMLLRAGQRKQLFVLHTKYLRECAPELFQHTNSVGGPADIHPNCARCGGSYNVFKSNPERVQKDKFVCGDCRQQVRVKSVEDHRTDEEKLKDLDYCDIHGADSIIRDQVPEIKAVAEDIRRRIATALITGKYKGDIVTRFGLLADHQTEFRPGWTLKDYADKYQVPEETAKTWIYRFRKHIAAHDSPLVQLNGETRKLAAKVLGVSDLNPQKAYLYEEESEAVCTE